MKLSSITVQLSAGVVLGYLSLGTASAAPLQNTATGFAQQQPFQMAAWEQYKIDKLEHAYHLLEHADGDYGGHRLEAMHEIKKAAGDLGIEIHGHEHADESQWKSDRRLREAKHLLEDIVVENGGVEHPHIRRAIKEIDKALAAK
jgi:hypothetical protein